MVNIFICLFTISMYVRIYIYIYEVSVQNFAIFVFLLLSCQSSLYILDINPLSNMCFLPVYSLSFTPTSVFSE